MKTIVSLSLAALLVTACSNAPQTEEQREQRAENIARSDAALRSAQTVQISGLSFRVAVIDDRSYALVDQVGTDEPYTAAQIKAAATAVSGCEATFMPGILGMLGGDIMTADLNELRSKVSGRFVGWRTDLSCLSGPWMLGS